MVVRVLKSILVGVDRSGDNTPAMELGLHWAKQFEAQLVGIGLAVGLSEQPMVPHGTQGTIDVRDAP